MMLIFALLMQVQVRVTVPTVRFEVVSVDEARAILEAGLRACVGIGQSSRHRALTPARLAGHLKYWLTSTDCFSVTTFLPSNFDT